MRNLHFLLLLVLLTSSVSAEELVQLRPYERRISLTSFTRPVKEMTIAGEVNGKYMNILVDVGDRVGPDQVVAEIDSTFVRLDLQKNTIGQQRASQQLTLKKKTLARYTNLLQTNSAAQATYDEAALKANIDELNLQNLRNEETRLKEMLKRHTLLAPAGWQVIERYVEPGEFAQQGQPILRLGNFNSLLVPFLLTFDELQLLRGADTIPLYLPDLNRTLVGKIFRVAPDFDEIQRKIPVDLTIAEKELREEQGLRGGLRVQLIIHGKIEDSSYVIPATAIISRYEASWLVTEKGQTIKVILLEGGTDGKDAIITGNNLTMDTFFQLFPETSL